MFGDSCYDSEDAVGQSNVATTAVGHENITASPQSLATFSSHHQPQSTPLCVPDHQPGPSCRWMHSDRVCENDNRYEASSNLLILWADEFSSVDRPIV